MVTLSRNNTRSIVKPRLASTTSGHSIPPGPLLCYLRNPASLARPLSETIAREENERRYRAKCLTSRVNACRFVYLSSDP